jgi:anti-anti-sigma factor
LSQSNGRINHEIRQKGSEKDLALNRLASIGQIAAGIAHEVKNPLTAVKGFLQLLKEESSHQYLDLAYSELENALDTLQNLLQVSKPDLENEPFSSINLCSELESLLYLFRDQSYRVQIETSFSDVNQKVYGRKNQLKKAFFNLLKNACEAISDTGKITVKHYKENGSITISITDTGVGIPKEQLNLLGTPFFTSKADGTGMGLTQVFSTIYEHRGTIQVQSQVGAGTTFIIQFPTSELNKWGVIKLNLQYIEKQTFVEFFRHNQRFFSESLENHGEAIFNSLQNSKIDKEAILHSANEIIHLLSDSNEHGLIIQAKEHGRNWAKSNLDLILKLEWFQTIRKVYWDFLYNYYRHEEIGKEELFELERSVNFNLDTYIKHFASSYTEYKNELIRSQREAIEDLSVPVIPLSDSMAILPIVGTIDTLRAKKIQEHVLVQVYQLKLEQIIIDLSGVAFMDTAVVGHLFKIVNGIGIQGCKAIITGIRPEITNAIVELGIQLNERVETRGTLQQAMEEYERELQR